MDWTLDERTQFETILRGWADTKEALQMKSFLQHGQISTYDHCVCVARMSFLLNRRFALGADEESMVRGAFLHDFYLYDWHDCTQRAGRWHGFRHPAIALANAERLYPLNAKERDIIRSHMWPLTFLHWPHSREALLVCLADKICSTRETLLCRRVTVRPAGF